MDGISIAIGTNLTLTTMIVFVLLELKADHKHLKSQFRSLTNDFKKVKESVWRIEEKLGTKP
jgi:hypothetical protein